MANRKLKVPKRILCSGLFRSLGIPVVAFSVLSALVQGTEGRMWSDWEMYAIFGLMIGIYLYMSVVCLLTTILPMLSESYSSKFLLLGYLGVFIGVPVLVCYNFGLTTLSFDNLFVGLFMLGLYGFSAVFIVHIVFLSIDRLAQFLDQSKGDSSENSESRGHIRVEEVAGPLLLSVTITVFMIAMPFADDGVDWSWLFVITMMLLAEGSYAVIRLSPFYKKLA